MLEQCQALFLNAHADDLAQILAVALQGEPLPTPTDFRGPAEVRMYHLDMPVSDRQRALQVVTSAAAERQGPQRGLGGFVEAWQEYVGFVDPVPDNSTGKAPAE